jgi:hypothetical protein
MNVYINMLIIVGLSAASLILFSGCKRCNDISTYTEDKFVAVYPGIWGLKGMKPSRL